MTTLANHETIGGILREIREMGRPEGDDRPGAQEDDLYSENVRGWAVAQTICAVNGMVSSIEELSGLREVSLQYIEDVVTHLRAYAEIARSLSRVAVMVGFDDLMAASRHAISADDLLMSVADGAPTPAVRMRDVDTSRMPEVEMMQHLMVVQTHRRLSEILFTVVSTSVEIVMYSLANVLLEEEATNLSDDAWAVLQRAKAMSEAA